MSKPTVRARPLSPHLTVYRFTITMAMSIIHRITGGALYFGTLLVAWWLVAAATSPEQFDRANAVMGSWFGLLVLFGFTFAMYQHLLGGVRHAIWDTGIGMEKNTASAISWATLVGAVALTLLTWGAFYLIG